jgi:hypothetical protein
MAALPRTWRWPPEAAAMWPLISGQHSRGAVRARPGPATEAQPTCGGSTRFASAGCAHGWEARSLFCPKDKSSMCMQPPALPEAFQLNHWGSRRPRAGAWPYRREEVGSHRARRYPPGELSVVPRVPACWKWLVGCIRRSYVRAHCRRMLACLSASHSFCVQP